MKHSRRSIPAVALAVAAFAMSLVSQQAPPPAPPAAD